MEVSTDSEEEIYGGRYSLDSSPQDDKVNRAPNGTTGRFANSTLRQQNYMSDPVYSDFSSSKETVGKQQQFRGTNGVGVGVGRYPIGEDDYSEDETSDSPRSSEFAAHMGSKRGDIPSRGSYPSEGYSSSVPLHAEVPASAEKVTACFRQCSDWFLCKISWLTFRLWTVQRQEALISLFSYKILNC